MRIIGEIEHPILKITVFQMDNKLSVKFESGLYEQTYKFRSGEGLDSMEDLRRVLDGPFIEAVMASLKQMHRQRTAAVSRQLPPEPEEEFEEII